ncbi:hypothetical protein [Parvularcula maris]|uniref:Uncharacterized protein n=1 Tax=Parvularcula maris TaxID=2965077 RepID=A0A9X2L7X7_9PROT|nr:hypothetical protein [Parvularcula maris]MCQ8184584.1 hypothetical protein [Parvularcula maris]
MANDDHGLSGLFGDDGVPATSKPKAPAAVPADDDLPPVIDDADKSPLDLLADKIGLDLTEEDDDELPPAAAEAEDEPEAFHRSPFQAEAPADEAEEPASEAHDPFSIALTQGAVGPIGMGAGEEVSPQAAAMPLPRTAPPAEAHQGGILCFLVSGDDDRGRKRTLEALNVAAGNGAVRLRSLPEEPEEMDRVLEDALSTTDCDYVAFLSGGTEPADDWALECSKAFAELPKTGALSVCAANADPLSPWARVAFFMDEAERKKGRSQGSDTMVFRKSVLRELHEQLGPILRDGHLLDAISGRGHRINPATEARVSIATPSDRREVMRRVRLQAKRSASLQARKMNPVVRYLMVPAMFLSSPFRLMAVRKAAKEAVGGAQFREVASKAMMAVLADRRVRAMTLLTGGK